MMEKMDSGRFLVIVLSIVCILFAIASYDYHKSKPQMLRKQACAQQALNDFTAGRTMRVDLDKCNKIK